MAVLAAAAKRSSPLHPLDAVEGAAGWRAKSATGTSQAALVAAAAAVVVTGLWQERMAMQNE